MVGCPDETCQKRIDSFMTKINNILFGADEEHGFSKRISLVETCVKQKISKMWLISASITVIAILCTIFLPTINSGIRTLNEIKATEIILSERMTVNKGNIQENKSVIKDLDNEWDERIRTMEQNIILNFDLKMKILEEKYIKK